MYVAFVENREHDVHDEHSERHQEGQTGDRAGKRLRLTNQLCTHSRRNNFRGRLSNEVCRITQSHTWFQIEEQRHACELVKVINGLWSKCRSPTDEFSKWNESLTVI